MKQPIKMIPGDELHLTALMAPFSLNLVTGQDRQHLLGYGRAAFEAGKAGQCLHQIQEPAAAEQAAWHAGLDEGRAQAEQPEDARELVTLALGLSLPPKGGPSFAWSYLLSSIRELVKCEEELTLLKAGMDMSKAAPAAVAVPDECAAFEAKFRHLDLSQKPDAWGHARYSHDAISLAWEAWQARAALAATPAAAPVVLSESAEPIIEKLLALARIVDIAVEDWGESFEDGSMDVKFHSDVVTELDSILDHFDGLPEGPDDNVIESGPVKAARILRALLATATGLPAQVVLDFEKIGTAGPFPISNGRVKLPEVTMVDLARMLKSTIDALAQADARDAELLRGLHWATTLLDTPAGDAYHEAMQAEAMNVSDALNGEIAKASIEQYRDILNAGLTAARAAIGTAKEGDTA